MLQQQTYCAKQKTLESLKKKLLKLQQQQPLSPGLLHKGQRETLSSALVCASGFAVLGLVEGICSAGGLVLLVDGLVGLPVSRYRGKTCRKKSHKSSTRPLQCICIIYDPCSRPPTTVDAHIKTAGTRKIKSFVFSRLSQGLCVHRFTTQLGRFVIWT